MRINRVIAGLICAIALSSCSVIRMFSSDSATSPAPPTPKAGIVYTHLGVQTKTSGCVPAGALPDSACTPGAIFPDATLSQICTPGYTRTVRNVPTALKDQVYAEYGITSHAAGEYEVDHLIPLELGGANDISNLWPEAASPQPGFHEKDQVENYLHTQMCSGALSLQQAQQVIATNWLAAYSSMTGGAQLPLSGQGIQPTTTPKGSDTGPNGAVALCNDGTYWYGATHRGACSHHKGVKQFYK